MEKTPRPGAPSSRAKGNCPRAGHIICLHSGNWRCSYRRALLPASRKCPAPGAHPFVPGAFSPSNARQHAETRPLALRTGPLTLLVTNGRRERGRKTRRRQTIDVSQHTRGMRGVSRPVDTVRSTLPPCRLIASLGTCSVRIRTGLALKLGAMPMRPLRGQRVGLARGGPLADMDCKIRWSEARARKILYARPGESVRVRGPLRFQRPPDRR